MVRPQDTLYSIAWRHNLDYRELAKWNHIGGDYRLTVGQVLRLQPGGAPSRRGATAASTATSATAPRGAAASGSTSPGGAGQAQANRAAKPASPGARGRPAASTDTARNAASAASAAKWLWPTERTSAPRPVPGGGILLFGHLGQDVRASGAGHVVYTGNGIRGYGNLIIIKHGETLLSSYAHNQEMLVHEGQDVTAGQVIAHMGSGAHQTSVLYFEIRVNGKPTDPLPLLSRSE